MDEQSMSGKPSTSPRYFEDFAIGDRIIAPGRYVLHEEEILDFARRYDPQVIHLDAEAAKQSIFNGLSASGWHSLAITMRLMEEAKPLGSLPVTGLGAELRWLKPVRPGDVLRAEGEVVNLWPLQSKPDHGLIQIRVTTYDQTEAPVIVQTWSWIVPKASRYRDG